MALIKYRERVDFAFFDYGTSDRDLFRNLIRVCADDDFVPLTLA